MGNLHKCTICGEEAMQIKDIHLDYDDNGVYKELECKGEVCDFCHEIVLFNAEE